MISSLYSTSVFSSLVLSPYPQLIVFSTEIPRHLTQNHVQRGNILILVQVTQDYQANIRYIFIVEVYQKNL